MRGPTPAEPAGCARLGSDCVPPDLDALSEEGQILADVHAHNVGLAPPTAHPASSRRDRTTEHDMTVRAMIWLQRVAGNNSVNALLDEHASARGSTPARPAVQRLAAELQVRGKFEDAGSHPKQVFFDFNSAVVDRKERAKIDAFLQTSPPPTAVTAIASEEGGAAVNEPLAQNRGAAVAGIIARRAPGPRVDVSLGAAIDNPDYRFMRRVDLAPASSSQEDECVVDADCDARLVTAMEKAQALARLAQSAADKPDASVRVALDDAFHASDDATARTVADGYDAIVRELELLKVPGRHSCETPCTNPICVGDTRAAFDPDTHSMIGCPALKDTSKSVVETVLHEAVHGAPEIRGDDFARIFEPLFPFLTTKAALRNPDSYVEFTRALTTGPTTPRPATGDFDASMSDDQKSAVRKAVAWATTRLLAAEDRSNFVYFALTAGHKDPDKAGEVDKVANDRTVLKREKFGTTAPPDPPIDRDQWIVEGVSNRLHKLVVAVGSMPTITQGPAVKWSRKKNELHVNQAFFAADVSQQARLIEFALILNDPDIPSSRANNYLLVIDQFGGLDVSPTEGPP